MTPPLQPACGNPACRKGGRAARFCLHTASAGLLASWLAVLPAVTAFQTAEPMPSVWQRLQDGMTGAGACAA